MSWIRDAMFIAGVAALSAGLYLYDPRLALCGGGAVLIAAATVSAFLSAARSEH